MVPYHGTKVHQCLRPDHPVGGSGFGCFHEVVKAIQELGYIYDDETIHLSELEYICKSNIIKLSVHLSSELVLLLAKNGSDWKNIGIGFTCDNRGEKQIQLHLYVLSLVPCTRLCGFFPDSHSRTQSNMASWDIHELKRESNLQLCPFSQQ